MEEMIASGVQTAFSILVASYLLVRMEARIEGLTQAVSDLRGTIERASQFQAGGGVDG
ncbi:MAG: YvrJ family protein [Thermanaerothrix sp.]|nr:YvrJ family protein [Thermanaerothrix sp.]